MGVIIGAGGGTPLGVIIGAGGGSFFALPRPVGADGIRGLAGLTGIAALAPCTAEAPCTVSVHPSWTIIVRSSCSAPGASAAGSSIRQLRSRDASDSIPSFSAMSSPKSCFSCAAARLRSTPSLSVMRARSAEANSWALAKRSAGFFASAFASTASNPRGTSRRSGSIGSG